MRGFKLTAGLTALLLVFVALVAYFRAPLFIYFAQPYLQQALSQALAEQAPAYAKAHSATPVALTCVDFSLTADLDLVFSEICIDHPLLTLTLNGLSVQWTSGPQVSITGIELDRLELVVTQDISPLFVNPQAEQQAVPATAAAKPSDWLDQVLLQTTRRLNNLPEITLNIEQLSYQNVSVHDKAPVYTGTLVKGNSRLSLSLTSKQQKLFNLDLAWADNKPSAEQPESGQLTGQLTLQLAPVHQLLVEHVGMLPALIAPYMLLADEQGQSVTISGQLISQFSWQLGKLTAQSELKDSLLAGTLDHSNFSQITHPSAKLPLLVTTWLHWHTSVSDNLINIDFIKPSLDQKTAERPAINQISVTFEDTLVIDALARQHLSQQLITLLEDNASQALVLSAGTGLQIDLNQQQLMVPALTLHSQNKQAGLNLALTQLHLPFDAGDPASAQFHLAIKAKVSALQQVTHSPVDIVLAGSIKSDQQQITLAFDSKSQINLRQLTLNAADDKDNAEPASAARFSLPTALLNLQGLVRLKQLKSPGNRTLLPEFDVTLSSDLRQLSAPDLLLTPADVRLNATIKGSPDQLRVKGDLQVNHLALAQFNLSGAINRPKFNIFGADIKLVELLQTDLLAKYTANLALELLDGKLDYAVSGQINNWQDITQEIGQDTGQEPLTLSLALSDISAKIDEIWVQDVNWQQQFSIQDGVIASRQQDNNLTVALIDVGSELNQLAASTTLNLTPQGLDLSLENVSGKAFGGSFTIPRASWPLAADKPVVLNLSAIDLAKLVELEQQQGITVTGKISGSLPINYNELGLTISQGRLYNIEEGIIQIKDNPVVAQLKQNSTELKLAFDALQNLYYHQLTSEVSMTNDGQMLLKTVIKGINPDLDNEVNFNFQLDYDLLGLIQSLRITDDFEQQIYRNAQDK